MDATDEEVLAWLEKYPARLEMLRLSLDAAQDRSVKDMVYAARLVYADDWKKWALKFMP